MGKKNKQKQQVVDYFLSIHIGIAAGPIDAVTGIYVGEKEAWSGEATAEGPIVIDKKSLFGGNKQEGGVSGVAYYLPGGPTQILPNGLAARFDRTAATCPATRGKSSIFFVGSVDSRLGFYWSSNSPYIQEISIRGRRKPAVLDPAKGLIGADANPAHIIYECLTNPDWGMGSSAGLIDTASFNEAADLFISEALGLSMQWSQQATVEEFINEVLKHVNATLFTHPQTGLHTLKPIRGGYDAATLPLLTPDNCEVVTWQDKAWGETINEIVVTWTNPNNENEETVTMQDLGNISMQGAIVSDSRNYFGVRNADLAMKLAARDLRSAAAPLSSCEVNADRSLAGLVPGGVVRMTYPEHGVSELVMRITKLNYGRPSQPAIKLSLIEDVFALTTSAYVTPPNTSWIDPSEAPRPIDFVRVITLPYYVVTQLVSQTDLGAIEYPEVVAGILAAQDGEDTISYDLMGEVVLANGTTQFEVLGTRPLIGHAVLANPLSAQAISSNVVFSNLTRGSAPVVAGLAVIGNASDELMELVLLDLQEVSGWRLWRGVLDTVPRTWPAGTPIWFIDNDTDFYDETARAAGEVVEYKILPRTSKGVLDEDDAEVVSDTLNGRPHLPSRPANVVVGGSAFGEVSLPALADVAVTWARRNRLSEDNQILKWTDSDVTPEGGQTTTITIRAIDGTLLATHDALAGTSFTIPYASFGGRRRGSIKVTAERDGLESLQGHEVPYQITGLPSGYGYDYGFSYGST